MQSLARGRAVARVHGYILEVHVATAWRQYVSDATVDQGRVGFDLRSDAVITTPGRIEESTIKLQVQHQPGNIHRARWQRQNRECGDLTGRRRADSIVDYHRVIPRVGRSHRVDRQNPRAGARDEAVVRERV